MKTPKVTAGARIDAADPALHASRNGAGAVRVRQFIARIWIDAVALVVIGIVFIVPFVFIVLTAAKTEQEAALFEFSWPSPFQLVQNIRDVVVYGDNRMLLALWNSALLTVGSVTLIVLLGAMVAFVIQRRRDRVASIASTVMLSGLIIPPAVVPTIFLLQSLGIYKTLLGLILVEVAFTLPFATLTLRAFMSTIPREIDEAALIDGASPVRVFFGIILPLLKPALVTVIIVSSVGIYNDFAHPLYFLPGEENVTAQLTLFSFISQFSSQWNLLFANVVVITIPPLILFMFFQRQIVAGMTSGAVKG
jgi:raffinose/stachyose/melibiose transport system permease protein